MTFYLNPIPGNPAFGKLLKDKYSSDYIETIKRRRGVFPSRRIEKIVANRERFLISNKSNLISNLYYNEDLKNVNTLTNFYNESNVKVNPNNSPFYSYYKIDPYGSLFGRNYCGTNNFTNYMRLNTF
jgi:hypothetical protein